jgi:isoleucyl-tRNA synthetase
MNGIAAHDRAPYDTVITHGWTLDAHGRAMHKSAGNAIEPDKVIKQSGAETIRLWCVSSNYFDDMRGSDEILQRVTDGYRKLRNTARFALGNLDGFDPERDSVPVEEMEEIDRWALAELNRVTKEVWAAYEAYEFHNVYRGLYSFATVTLSARYFDIIKDRLYTFAPRNKARRSAQTALLQICDALARMLGPILVFTADEIWENLPGRREESIHLALLPAASDARDENHDALLAEWERLYAIRDDVLRGLEEARVAKRIGSSLQAKVILKAAGGALELLQKHQKDLRYLFIVSQVELGNSDASEGVSITITDADGTKCERCWNYSTHVGESQTYPTVCERCLAALQEIEQE